MSNQPRESPVLLNGNYRTKAGSTVAISGAHSGIALVSFDWFEEEGACCDCEVNPYPEEDRGDWWLTWTCRSHEGSRARLEEIEEATNG